ncbi:VOC family protein [Rehaibacterium terrae]|jgi:PhnB protein|uniref:PhnB protein n=1 Tax=Rehaibacterium terrae TaxID=1341696 RepID=A0A7W8DEY4_9GAMM|nr:VOC family protein [Rehaibacterium terrae]MBB5015930.1 PhnB protein [Rehaibacterium terrae]
MLIQPYLFFNGNCRQAFDFYRDALGAEYETLMRYRDSPEPPPPECAPPGWEDKVMHASLRIGSLRLMGSDDGSGQTARPQGFSLSLSVPDADAADRVFAALADGGSVIMPLGETFWSPRFGMLTDRFGVGWMIGVEA